MAYKKFYAPQDELEKSDLKKETQEKTSARSTAIETEKQLQRHTLHLNFGSKGPSGKKDHRPF